MNLLHYTGAIDISGVRDTVEGWSPSLSNLLFVTVEDSEAPDAALPEDGAANGGDAASATEPESDAQTDAILPDDGALNEADASQTNTGDTQSGLAPVAPAA